MRTGARGVWRALVWIAMVCLLVAGYAAGGLVNGGILGADLGVLVAVLLYGLIQALLPLSLRPPYVAGGEPTQAVRRGSADRLARALRLVGPGAADTDLARLDAGARLYLLCYGPSAPGSLLLRRLPDGTVDVAWRPRKSRVVVPLPHRPAFSLNEGAVQQNGWQSRLGMTVSVGLAGESYWVRPLDAELLRLVFLPETAPAVSVTA